MENQDKSNPQKKDTVKDNNAKPDATGTETQAKSPQDNRQDEQKVADKSSDKAKNSTAKSADTAKKNTAAKAPAAPAPQPVKEKKSGGSGFATFLSLVALGVGGSSLYLQTVPGAKIPFLSDRLTTSGNSTEVQEVQNANMPTEALQNVETKLADFESKLSALSSVEPTSSNAQVDLSSFEAKLAQLEQQIAQAPKETTAAVSGDASAQLNTFAQEQENLKQQLQQALSANQQLQQNIGELKKEQTFLSGSVNAFAQQLPQANDADIWKLKDIELSLNQANRQLQDVYDIDAVKTQLGQALEQLVALKRSDLVSVANTMQKDIAALEAVSVPDINAVVNQLDELSTSATSLPLIGESVEDVTEEATDSSISEAGAGLLKSLTDLVEIKKDGKSIRPVVSNELRELSRQKTQLTLESASVAYLSGQYELFAQRIDTAKEWVEAHFDVSAGVTQEWLQMASQLSEQIPEADLPNISASINALAQAQQAGE